MGEDRTRVMGEVECKGERTGADHSRGREMLLLPFGPKERVHCARELGGESDHSDGS